MKALGKYFSFNELTCTSCGLLNIPNETQTANLVSLVKNILDPLREHYEKLILVNSGFRSVAVNKLVNGAINSEHLYGYAADLDCADNASLFCLIRDNFTFNELIWELGDDEQPNWIHVSFRPDHNLKKISRCIKVHGQRKYIKI